MALDVPLPDKAFMDTFEAATEETVVLPYYIDQFGRPLPHLFLTSKEGFTERILR